MIKEKLRRIILKTLFLLYQKKIINFCLGKTFDNIFIQKIKQCHYGDYSCNIAMLLSKEVKQSSFLIAKMIQKYFLLNNFILKLEIANFGFLNFTIKDKRLLSVLNKMFKKKDLFHFFLKKNRRFLLEFISANPTGPLHLGHARNIFLGDVLIKVLQTIGYCVVTEFYINDYGVQIKILAKSIYWRYKTLLGGKKCLNEKYYPSDYIIDIANGIISRDGNKWFQEDKKVWLYYFINYGIFYNLNLIKKNLIKLNIKIDNWFSEKFLYKSNRIKSLMFSYCKDNKVYQGTKSNSLKEKIRRENCNASKYINQQLGGIFLKTTLLGDSEDRILLKRNNIPVYLTGDLAYHKYKIDRGFSKIIDIFGSDHVGHVSRIKIGMRLLGLNIQKLDFILIQMVKLFQEGKELKFSKRSGNIYGIDCLTSEIGKNATRFIFIVKSSNVPFNFDLILNLEKNSENFLFYIQYGYTRMCSLLSKAFKNNVQLKKLVHSNFFSYLLCLPIEKSLIKKLLEYPSVILNCSDKLEVYHIINFCYDLIVRFHFYFTAYRNNFLIISENKELTVARLFLVQSIKKVLKHALDVLGISVSKFVNVKMDNK